MATVTTLKKKKLVYKQDSDGVFRLKKVDDDDSAAAPVASPTNELHDCSYKIIDHNADKITPVVPAPTDSIIPEDIQSVVPPTDVSWTSSGRSGKAHDPNPRKKSTSKTTPKAPKDTTATGGFKLDWITQAKHTVMSEAKQFHVPSFGLGIVAASVVYVSRAVLIRYAFLLFNVLKFGILWGVLVGGLCWWFGLIKPQDAERLEEAWMNLKTKLGMSSHEEPQHEDDDVDSQSDQQSHSDHSDQQSQSSVHSDDPPPMQRKNTLTRVTPFKFTPKSDKYSSTPDLLQHASKPPPKLQRLNTTGPRNPPPTISPVKSPQKTPTRRRNGSTDSTSSHKKLPPYPKEAEELPFINEVKLLSGDADSQLSHDDAPKRSNTTMSKKSVLGTRSNYNRFLANVDGED